MISLPHPHQDVYVPTPNEIEERCREIQAGWTEQEKDRRLGQVVPRKRFSTRIVKCHLKENEMEFAN